MGILNQFPNSGGGVSPIDSIQFVTMTVASGSQNGAATISSINPDRSTLHVLGTKVNSSSGTTAHSTFCRVAITSATQVVASRDTNLAMYTLTVTAVVIQWKTGVLVGAVQRGTLGIATADIFKTATISTVDEDMTVVSFNGASSSNNSDAYVAQTFARVSLTSPTQVRADRNASGFQLDVNYEVYQFSPDWVDAVAKVQIQSQALNNNLVISNGSSGSYDDQNSLAIFAGYQTSDCLNVMGAVGAYGSEGVYANVFPQSSGAGSGQYMNVFVIYWNKPVIKHKTLRHIKHVGGTGEPKSVTLPTAFEAGKTAMFWLGSSVSLNSFNPYKFLCSASFTAPSTIASDRGQDVDNVTQSLELVEFY